MPDAQATSSPEASHRLLDPGTWVALTKAARRALEVLEDAYARELTATTLFGRLRERLRAALEPEVRLADHPLVVARREQFLAAVLGAIETEAEAQALLAAPSFLTAAWLRIPELDYHIDGLKAAYAVARIRPDPRSEGPDIDPTAASTTATDVPPRRSRVPTG